MSKVVDLQGNEIIEKDFSSTEEIEAHLLSMPDLEPGEEEWLASIKDMAPKIKIDKDILEEVYAHLKELGDHYGYDYPEDMICDLLNNGMIDLRFGDPDGVL